MKGVKPRDVCVSVPFWYRHPKLEIFLRLWTFLATKKNYTVLSGITMPTA